MHVFNDSLSPTIAEIESLHLVLSFIPSCCPGHLVAFMFFGFLGKFFVREIMWRVQVFMQDRRSKDNHLHSRPQDVMMD
jgi:hypothetical protein